METISIHQPHDKLFKLALEEIAVAKEFFDAHLPKHIREKIDLNRLKFENHGFIDPIYKETEADVLCKTTDFKQFLEKLIPWLSEVEAQGRCGAFLARFVIIYIIYRVPQADKAC